jgi:ABC-type multidrug transport system ATPase subunit
MEIRLSGIAKRYNREWIFSGIDHTFQQGNSYAITGPNGSGKSTLLQVISGFQLPSEGEISWNSKNGLINPEQWFSHSSICTPYLELVEDLTLTEHLGFHFSFKAIRQNISIRDLTKIGYFEDAVNKEIRYFSSGMKQRLKLLLALYSDVPVVLLDEPTTNMDKAGVEWYRTQLKSLQIPLLIIASNQLHEYEFCDVVLDIPAYKNVDK